MDVEVLAFDGNYSVSEIVMTDATAALLIPIGLAFSVCFVIVIWWSWRVGR